MKKQEKFAYFWFEGRSFCQNVYPCHNQAHHWIPTSDFICTSLSFLNCEPWLVFPSEYFLLDKITYYLSLQEKISIALCDSFVLLRMKSLRFKGGVREARDISEAMTRSLQKIREVLVENFIHFTKNTIWAWCLSSKWSQRGYLWNVSRRQFETFKEEWNLKFS